MSVALGSYGEKQYHVPEWEHNAASSGQNAPKSQPSVKAGWSDKFNTILPPHRRYIGMSRKVFLWVLLAVLLVLLALIIGLAVGLNKSR